MSAQHEQNTSTPETAPALSSRLPRSLRGYDRAATEVLFAEAATRSAELERQCAALREQMAELQEEIERHRVQEQLVGKTLIVATSHATTIKDKARHEAELFLSKARTELQRRTEQADRVDRHRTEAERDLVRLRRLAQEMQSGLEGFLTHAMEQLSASDEAEPQPAQVVPAPATLVTALEGAVEREQFGARNGADGVQVPRFEP